MALPESGAAWPPPHMAAAYREMRTDDAWYAGDARRLAAMCLLITQSTILSADSVEPILDADALATELSRITATRGGGGPAVLRLDNGPEMIAAALAEWAGTRTGMLFIPPGEPWRNPFIESFNGRLRDECLNIHLFWSLTHAKVTIGDWKEEYNHDRPHSSLGYRTPRAYAAICTH